MTSNVDLKVKALNWLWLTIAHFFDTTCTDLSTFGFVLLCKELSE